MYPKSPYAVPVGSFRSPVAIPTTDPNEGPFFYIPVNCTWMPLIAGSLKQLLLQSTWDTDDPDALQAVQGKVFNLIASFNCATAQSLNSLCGSPSVSGGTEVEDCMGCCLKWVNGILSTKNCDGNWVPIEGVQPTIPPGGGTPPPPSGGCAQYHFSWEASSFRLVPPTVSSGDTLTLTGLQGVSFNEHTNRWYCPDGSRFFARCISGLTDVDDSAFSATLPVGSVMIGLTNDVANAQPQAITDPYWYNITDGNPFTVPDGFTDAFVIIVVNTRDLPSNSGLMNADLEVCNNVPGSVDITYPVAGSGPSTVALDTTFTISSTEWNNGSFVENLAHVVFSRAIQLEVISVTDWTAYTGTGDYEGNWTDEAGAGHSFHVPQSFDPATDLNGVSMKDFGTTSSTAWSMDVQVHEL